MFRQYFIENIENSLTKTQNVKWTKHTIVEYANVDAVVRCQFLVGVPRRPSATTFFMKNYEFDPQMKHISGRFLSTTLTSRVMLATRPKDFSRY